MTFDLPRYAVFVAEWGAIALAWREYNRRRPGRPMPQVYWLILGMLVILQLYGEAWRR